jgi:hypothetical protein
MSNFTPAAGKRYPTAKKYRFRREEYELKKPTELGELF